MGYSYESIDVNSALFSQVLALRANAYGREAAGLSDEIDSYSRHFVARWGTEIHGALRVTCRRDGQLESERHYPEWLLDEFGDQISGSSRLCVSPKLSGSSTLPLELARFAWCTCLPLGIRLDVSKVRLKAVPFYLKMGYYFVRNLIFEFDRWNTRCALIAFPANSNRQTSLSELFEGIDAPCDLETSTNGGAFSSSYREFLDFVNAAPAGCE